MGLEMEGSPVRMAEKEGGTVGGSSKPVDDRIVDPKSKSQNENNLCSLPHLVPGHGFLTNTSMSSSIHSEGASSK